MPDTGRIVLQRVRSSFNASKQVSVTTQPHLVPSRGIGRTTALTRYSNSGDASDRLANATVGPAVAISPFTNASGVTDVQRARSFTTAMSATEQSGSRVRGSIRATNY